MATTTQSSGIDGFEPCALCPTKHHRNRPSFCQCKHCSIPLCVDCLKEHHEELLQDVAQISHQYNELQQLLQTKQTMIFDETTKSIEEANRYFESYMNELRETQRKIIAEMERAKQHARVKREACDEYKIQMFAFCRNMYVNLTQICGQLVMKFKV